MRAAMVLGLLDGLVIALLGFGVVLVYKAERFVNFANAQLGVVPALLLSKLVLDAGLSWFVAFPLMVALGVAIGATSRIVIISRLEQASRASVMIATLGLSQVLLALVLFDWLGADPRRLGEQGYPMPVDVYWRFDALAITGRHVLIAAVVAPTLLGLTAWLRFSSFGRTMRAAAANPAAARLAGIDVRRTATAAWAIAGGVSVVGAVVTAPSRSAIELQTLSPLLLFLALGAAALAGFTSLRAVVVAGLVLGVAQGVGSFVGDGDAAGVLAAFAVTMVGLLVRSFMWRPAPNESWTERSEQSFEVPEEIAGRWFTQRWVVPLVAVLVATALPFLPWLSAPHRTYVLAQFAVYAVATMSLTLLSGWGGQIGLGQFTFVAIGAFAAARVATHGWSLFATIVVAAAAGAVAGLAIALPAARGRGLSLAVASLGLAVVGSAWLFEQPWVAGPGTIDAPPAYAFGLGRLTTQRSVYFAALVVLVVVGLGLVRLRRSNAGRSILAVRDNERAAAGFGFSPLAVRVATFAASGSIAAVAGALWLAVNRNISANSFSADGSLLLVSAAVIGGLNYVRGALIGSLIVFGVPLLFKSQIDQILGGSYQLQLLLGGIGLIAVQMANPGGIAAARRRGLQGWLEWIAARSRPARPVTGVPTRAPARPRRSDPSGAALAVRDVSVQFGGVHAVDTVALEVAAGEIVGVIGANGAGKSALLDAICGFVPARGHVVLNGRSIGALSPARRAHAGLGRGFQDARLFPGLTVRETIELALANAHPIGVFGAVIGPPWVRMAQRSLASEATVAIDRFGLTDYADTPIDRLSTGVRHLCELAAQFAAAPGLLILDEPTAGVAQRESEAFGPIIRGVAEDLGCAVLVVEHDMRLVLSVADRVYCMDRGRVIAQGPPAVVFDDPAVVATYLGASRRGAKRRVGTAR